MTFGKWALAAVFEKRAQVFEIQEGRSDLKEVHTINARSAKWALRAIVYKRALNYMIWFRYIDIP